MFALHETTQRRVCRVTFLVLCVVPTLLTLVGIAYCNRPWREHDWQRALGQRLHVRAALEEITSPQPGRTVLTQLRLADLRSDQTLGSMGTLSIQRENSRLTLRVDHLELQAEQLPAFATAVTIWLATSEPIPFDFHADHLTITNSSLQTVKLDNLSIRSDTSDPNHVRFRLTALDDAGATFQLALEKEKNRLCSKLDTRQVPLPAWLIGKLVPGFAGCGGAKFSGEVKVTVENETPRIRGELRGLFDDVNLQQWIGIASPHRLQGVCQLQLKKFIWSDVGIEAAQGSIEVVRGAASYSLFVQRAAPDLFLCTAAGPGWQKLKPTSWEELISFDQLKLSFQMTSAGITLAGGCPEGALMMAADGALLYGPPEGAVRPVSNLVQLFHYPQQGYIPHTRAAHAMAKELPLPGSTSGASETMRK